MTMDWTMALVLTLAAGLVVYLFVALLAPEKFS
jgi:K+-transporting ATPase KdpF subunit